MTYLTRLLVTRFLSSLTERGTLSAVARTTLFSIGIASFVLGIGSAILRGFQEATCTLLQNVHSDLIIQAPHRQALAYERMDAVLKSEFPDLVVASTPIAQWYVVVQKDDPNDLSHVAQLQAIDPTRDASVRSLLKTVIASKADGLFPENGIVIGRVLARELHVNIGDTVTLLYTKGDTRETARNFGECSAVISGIFATGLEEVDAMLLFCSFAALQKMTKLASVTQVGVKLQPGVSAAQAKRQLRNRFRVNVFSWRDLYPALDTALKLEWWVITTILVLIALMASSTIVSLMLLLIMSKRQSIAILRAVGVSSKTIRTSLMMLGSLLVAVASGIGLLCAGALGWIIDYFHLIPLPEAYFVSSVPVSVDPIWFVCAWIGMVLIGVLVTWWATRALRQIQPVLAIKGG